MPCPSSCADLELLALERWRWWSKGSLLFKDRVAVVDDPLVTALKQAGAIIVSKAVFGTTRNPWDPRFTPGGSSGGSAAALAAGQVWGATGTDLGGSLRIPASFCGVVGLRPSPGLVPMAPPLPLSLPAVATLPTTGALQPPLPTAGIPQSSSPAPGGVLPMPSTVTTQLPLAADPGTPLPLNATSQPGPGLALHAPPLQPALPAPCTPTPPLSSLTVTSQSGPGVVHSLSGPMARNVPDLCLLLDAMVHGGRESCDLPHANPNHHQPLPTTTTDTEPLCDLSAQQGNVANHLIDAPAFVTAPQPEAEPVPAPSQQPSPPNACCDDNPQGSFAAASSTALLPSPPPGSFLASHTSPSPPPGSFLAAIQLDALHGVCGNVTRCAYSPDLGLGHAVAPLDPEVETICREAARQVASALGASLSEDVAPDCSDAPSIFRVLRALKARSLAPFVLSTLGQQVVKEELQAEVQRGMALTHEDVVDAVHAHAGYLGRWDRFFQDHQLLMTPTVITPPFNADVTWLRSHRGTPLPEYTDWLILTYAVSLVECPALSLPVGVTAAGLPVGLQLVAAGGQDQVVLAAGAAYERAHGWAAMVPRPVKQ